MIVVGVDGSEGSRRALQWAYGEARMRRCAVEVVSAWTADEGGPGERLVGERLRHVVETVRRQVDDPAPTSFEVRHGSAVDVLMSAAAEAELLILGSHGVSGLRHAGRVSVSAACARLVSCPCVVVPPPPPPAGHMGKDLVRISAGL